VGWVSLCALVELWCFAPLLEFFGTEHPHGCPDTHWP
jgi:hypothetical protein